MFTDIAGYTVLGQKNESLALETLERHRDLLRPIFSKHRGREVKTIGDAFLVEFESALEATLCAIDIQSSIHSLNLERGGKLQVRIGIHVGDVVHQGDDVLGDAVNVASRIYPLAEPGGVCISEQVHAHVKSKVSYPVVKLEARALKNVQELLDVYKVVLPWEGREAETGPAQQLDRHRLAVLPFANMSSNPDDEYFTDGMTEELITAMSGLQGLQVIARTSVMNYKRKEKNVSEIGKELKVGTVLEGSVRKAGNKVRVTVQLIDVPTESHLWSEKYDRELDDIFKIQDDIAGKIAQALRVKLISVREPAAKHAENIEAYTLYLKGRFYWNKRDKEGVEASLRLFQEAIKLDPDYAKAYSGLADAYSIGRINGLIDQADALTRSKEAAMKALELDDTLAEAHASLGLNLSADWSSEEAQREFRRAIELNPSYASAHQWYSQLLFDMGRAEEATEEIQKAHGLDPLAPFITFILGRTYELNGKLDEAIATYDKLIQSEPAFALPYLGRAWCFTFMGMKGKAKADLEAYGRFSRNEDAHKVGLIFSDLWFGEREKAPSMIEEVISKVGRPLVTELDVADCFAVLGNRDEFFKWVDKAIAARNIWPTYPSFLRYVPVYDKVKEDPRFPEIFKKLGLPY